jgi:hypothetical protein
MVEYGSDLEMRVGEALMQHDHTRDFDIEISDNNGVVELRGRVPSEEDRREVERLVESQAGVVKVVNNLQLLEGGRPVAEDDDFPEIDPDDEPPAYQLRTG